MKKELLVLVVVLALLSGILLSMIIILGNDRGEAGNDIPKTNSHNVNDVASEGTDQGSENTVETTEDTVPPVGTIGTDQEEGWDLPEF